MRHHFEKYCKDYKNIENYEKAKADNFKGWECHHRLETHNSDGERRLVNITAAELLALGMYYNRPAEELIFLTTIEHNAYDKGQQKSEETRNKISESKKGKYTGEKHPMYGKHHTEETRKKISETLKGKKLSEETQKKMSDAKKNMSEETKKKIGAAKKGTKYHLGKHWYNNGKINKRAYECPQGFIPGQLIK